MRLDAIKFKKTQTGKTYAVKLGSAVPNKEGTGYTVYLDSIPAPDSGQFQFSLVQPKDAGSQAPQTSAPMADDDIPF